MLQAVRERIGTVGGEYIYLTFHTNEKKKQKGEGIILIGENHSDHRSCLINANKVCGVRNQNEFIALFWFGIAGGSASCSNISNEIAAQSSE